MLKSKRTIGLFLMMAIILALSTGCAGVRSFPSVARAGDTVTVAAGFLDGMDRNNTTATLTAWGDPGTSADDIIDLDITDNIRSVFYLYPDPTSNVPNYSLAVYLDEVKQATVAIDLPNSLTPGDAEITINSTPDGIPLSYISNLTILPGQGSPEVFEEQRWGQQFVQNIKDLEPLHQAEVTFNSPTTNIGAVEIEIDFDETQISSQTINIITHTFTSMNFYQGSQNMFYWDDDGDVLRVRIVCPQGIVPYHLWFNIVYPQNITIPDPFTIVSGKTKILDIDGNVITDALAILEHKYQ